ncbi:glutamine--fructose-6-phosphate transaminase (isomerizing) [Candidatus Jorgensenbacteria bacterium]|nr:glutamine--fructose-6-phosphate transaminase (isomerizing) [Candidatus Jorgensenbacteria bacterium]
MCGIVGYIGKQRALPIILDGLKALEYRGYDSAGVAVVGKHGKGFQVRFAKAPGRISVLEGKLGDGTDFEGNVGIAHTRWATHGEPNEVNAHPHHDCKNNIFLAHNGIIENYKDLKSELLEKGHVFCSETDTETLVHLIEDMRDSDPNSTFEEVVMKALRRVRGTYGLAILDRREPEKIVAVRNFSPLLLGVGDGEYIIGSDASAVLKYTRQIVYLNDGEIAVLTPSRHHIFTLENQTVMRAPQEIDWTIEQAERGNYPHFMAKEIFEQPESIENSLRGRLVPEEGLAKLGGLESVEKDLRKAKRLIIAACGTAYYAGMVGKYMLEEYAGIPTEVDLASEFRYRKPVFREGDIFLAISQSGETADTLAALREAKQKGVLTLGIVNAVGSTIARETDAGVYQHIGPEIGVASTKAFTSQLTILALLTLFLGRQREMSITIGRRIAEELKQLPILVGRVLAGHQNIQTIVKKYSAHRNFLYLGRKYNFPVALEGALKLKEISYVHAEGCSAGEMKHGPIALIDETFPSIFLAPSDSVYEKVSSNIQEIKARRGPVIAIGTEGNGDLKRFTNDVIYIPKTLEMLTPMLSVVPLQLFAYYAALIKGCDVDKPRNLAKSVTVE